MVSRSKPANVLFVDSDPLYRDAFASTLEDQGYRVTLCSGMQDALKEAHASCPAVLVTAHQLSNATGLDLISRTREFAPEIACILTLPAGSEDSLGHDDNLKVPLAAIVRKPWDEFELIAAVRRAVELYHIRSASMSSTASNHQLLALVLEDDEAQAELASYYIEQVFGDGVKISVANTLNDAVALTHDEHFDLVVADLTLPDARGGDAVIRLRTAAPEAAIVVLSGVEDEALALQLVRHGVQDYLCKGSLDTTLFSRSLRYALERKRAELRLARLAHFDQLTGLVNRVSFHDRLDSCLRRSQRLGQIFAVGMVDIDHFKSINDKYGHAAGDRVIAEVAHRLRQSVRAYDTVARLGGDEFAVIIEDAEDAETVIEIARRIIGGLNQPIALDHEDINVSGSLGLAMYPKISLNPEGLLARADEALYEAKHMGRNCYVLARNEQVNGAIANGVMRSRLIDGLKRNELHVDYQPELDLHTGEIVRMEAFLRWQMDEQNSLGPSDFPWLLEDPTLLRSAGECLIVNVIERLRSWNQTGLEIPVSVNVAASQLADLSLVHLVRAELESAGVSGHQLFLELSEEFAHQLFDQRRYLLDELERSSVGLIIDDFGTQSSSLSLLARPQVCAVKLSPAFVGLDSDQKPGPLLQGIMNACKAMGVPVSAKSIESFAELDAARNIGCQSAQGFYIARPQASWDSNQLDLIVKKVRPQFENGSLRCAS